MRQEKLQYFMIDCQNKKNSGNLFDRELPIREAFFLLIDAKTIIMEYKQEQTRNMWVVDDYVYGRKTSGYRKACK